MYAIVETGGKQYKVSPGQTVDVEFLPLAEGEKVELKDVLLVAEGEKVKVGAPRLEGARVLATVAAQGKGDKVVVMKYKAKVRYHKKTGHRQRFTRLAIEKIEVEG